MGKCEICDLVFSLSKDREEHAIISHKCALKCISVGCNDSFHHFQHLLNHMELKHNIKNMRNILRRMDINRGKKNDVQKCRICGKICQTLNEIQDHFKVEHHGKHPFQCDVCGHKATDECRLKKHLLCHEPDRPREYCNICFKEFRNKVSLRTHRNMVHKMGKQYTCSYCGKILYSSQYVKKHEATHTGQKFKAVVCKYCGKTVEYTKLKNHELIHTGEKPFKCSDCPYRCIQRSNLRIHMRAVHKKELPRLAVGQKRYSGVFMDGTAANNDPFDLRSVFHQKLQMEK